MFSGALGELRGVAYTAPSPSQCFVIDNLVSVS